MCLDVSARGLSSESLACSSVCICYCESVSDIVHVYTDPRLVLSQKLTLSKTENNQVYWLFTF